MLTAAKIEQIISDLEGVEIRSLQMSELQHFHKEIFGVEFGGCSACREDAVSAIKKWYSKNSAPVEENLSYRFKKELRNKTINLLIGGNRVSIDKDNLTEANIKRLLAHDQYKHVLEVNPDFDSQKKKEDEVPIVLPVTTSTSNGAKAGEGISNKPLVTPNSKQKDSKPLTVKS